MKTRKALALFLALLLALSLVPAWALATGDPVEYEVEGGGTLYFDPDTGTITGTSSGLAENVTIPSSIDGVKVTAIGERAFAERYYVKNVTIPEGVTSIGDYAFFKCFYMLNCNLPGTVTEIGEWAFSNCASLSLMTIPNGVTVIREGTFQNCLSLPYVKIPNSVERIEKDAFNCCSVMPIINIPASVTTIEAGAFPNCTSLTNISVDSQNPSYSSQDGVLFNKDKTTLLYYPEDKPGASYAVPDTVTTIANYAFNSNKNLETVNISDGISVIGKGAFAGCSNLKDIYFAGSEAAFEAATKGAGSSDVTASAEIHYGTPTASLTNPFVDVSESDQWYDAVLWAYYAKPQVTNGVDATHFGPTQTVTRGQCAAFLWRAMGCPEPTSTYNPFVDVPSWQYYYKPILWAVEKGITKGTDATHFSPDQTLSTAHIITFLYRAKNPGTDGWYEGAASWAENGYGAGKPFGVSTPVNETTNCPRGYVVMFLQKAK